MVLSVQHPLVKKLAKERELYRIIKALKERLCPTEPDRRREVKERWKALKASPRMKDVHIWLDSWANVYEDMKELKLIDEELAIDVLIESRLPRYRFSKWIRS